MTQPVEESTFTLRRVQAMLGLSRTVVSGLISAGFVVPTRGPRTVLASSSSVPDA